MKRSFFQAAGVSILLYGCTTWTLPKRLEKKLDGIYTRMLWALLNESWRQHPTRHQLYGHLPPTMKTIQIRRTRQAGPICRCFPPDTMTQGQKPEGRLKNQTCRALLEKHICIYIYIYIYNFEHICIYMNTYLHTHTCKHIHTDR